MKLRWHNTPDEMISEIEHAVRCDVELINIEDPGSLIFHHVFLTKDYNGPHVFVWGVEGDDSFHCNYHDKTEWKTSAELDAERSSSI